MANGAKGSGGKSNGRSRARDQIRKTNEKTKEILEAVKRNVDRNINVLDDLTDSLLAEGSEHSQQDCAVELCAATVACWGNAMDLFHDVMKTCLDDQDAPKGSSRP
jgi:hypothetical protein